MAKKDRSLNKWKPFREMLNLRTDLDRFFNQFFGEDQGEQDEIWAPAIDLAENKDSYIVKAEIPGIKKEDIQVTVRDNILSIRGERHQEKEEENKTYHCIERYFGKFRRTIALPSEVKTEDIKAEYKDGVLSVILPKSEEAKPKQIDVDVS